MTETKPIDACQGTRLLAWYDRHARTLPWRVPPGQRPDPYRVWLSEIMLQQTTVVTVGRYFGRFLARWPDVRALAAAPREEVLREWAGLGYYARARNLHACAQRVVADHGGAFPDTLPALRALPGIGPYTAGAIAAIAFGRRELAIDGNVERVMTRLAAIDAPLPAAKPAIRARAAALMPARRPGDFAQALMDLGATICTPRAPACGACPLRAACKAAAAGDPARFPVKAAKPGRPLRRGTAFVLRDSSGAVWLTRRPATGLLGGMLQVPTTAWSGEGPTSADLAAGRPGPAAIWRRLETPVRHGFTHFELELTVEIASATGSPPGEGDWCPAAALARAGLPTVFRKVVAAALGAEPPPPPRLSRR
jgi:A/G-specific adenine glycosylase